MFWNHVPQFDSRLPAKNAANLPWRSARSDERRPFGWCESGIEARLRQETGLCARSARLEQRPPQNDERHAEVDHEACHVDERRHEGRRRAGGIEANTLQK